MPAGTPKALAAEIDRADETRLAALVAEHAETLDLGTVQRLLRHPFLTPPCLARLLEVPELRAVYGVRSRIARHPKTPLELAQMLVPDLFWRDLLEISVAMRLAPTLRRAAERYLVERWPRLTIGERVAVARRASGAVLAMLLKEGDERVIAAGLVNPRMRERTVLAIAADPNARPHVLERVFRSGRWGARYAVRRALSLNPQTSFRAQQAILASLRRQDLERVARTGALSSLVRGWARQALDGRRRGASAGRPR